MSQKSNLLLSTKEAAEVLGVSAGNLSHFARNRIIGFYQFGDNSTPRKFSKKHIQDFLAKYEFPPHPERLNDILKDDMYDEIEDEDELYEEASDKINENVKKED